MKGRTARQRDIARALTTLLPMAPYSDTEPIREAALARKMRELPPSIAVWIATVAHVRHAHTEYDQLLEEGYERDAARHFVIDDINRVLTTWRATRLLEVDEDEGE
jgi:hypothetical protein